MILPTLTGFEQRYRQSFEFPIMALEVPLPVGSDPDSLLAQLQLLCGMSLILQYATGSPVLKLLSIDTVDTSTIEFIGAVNLTAELSQDHRLSPDNVLAELCALPSSSAAFVESTAEAIRHSLRFAFAMGVEPSRTTTGPSLHIVSGRPDEPMVVDHREGDDPTDLFLDRTCLRWVSYTAGQADRMLAAPRLRVGESGITGPPFPLPLRRHGTFERRGQVDFAPMLDPQGELGAPTEGPRGMSVRPPQGELIDGAHGRAAVLDLLLEVHSLG